MLIWKLIYRYLGFCNPRFFVSGGGRDTTTASEDVGDIGHSLRFRGAQTLTHAAVADASTYQVHSLWVKRGKIGVAQALFQSYLNSGNYSFLIFNASDQLEFRQTNTSVITQKITNAVFRDPTAWLHIVLVTDTSQAAGSKNRIYVNGVEQTYATNNDSSNTILWYASGYTPSFGFNSPFAVYTDSYLARWCFVTGSGVTPSSFGYQNTEINEWVSKTQNQVKAVVDAGGTNSFMLDFDNATSLTTLGYDKSAKGNNWTLNNFSLTAGPTYDHMLDVPGNSYATLNPLDVSPTESSGRATITNGNLTVTGANQFARGWKIPASDKWYWEITLVDAYAGPPDIWGTHGVSSGLYGNCTGVSLYANTTGGIFQNGTKVQTFSTWTNSDVIGFAYDAATRSMSVYRNGTQLGTSVTADATDKYIHSYLNGTADTSSVAYNFGQRPFAYTPPTGFKALCQANLPTPAIKNPKKHFDVVTWAGDGSASKSITGCAFQPDLAWSKARNAAYSNRLFDSVRGVGSGKSLYSDLTLAEGGINDGLYGYISAMINGGFTAVNGSDAADAFLESGKTYTAWLWKAGGAPVTNNAGSIQSQVSANVEAGFSIVTWAGTNGAGTLGHGLLSPPELIVEFPRNGGVSQCVYHKSIGATNTLFISATNAQTADIRAWNNTSPTASVFSVREWANYGTGGQVAYCFHSVPGYSKVGNFGGVGASGLVYVPCGFKLRFLMIKRLDSADEWQMYDSARDQFNPMINELIANRSYVENSVTSNIGLAVDFMAQGFTVRGNEQGNISGGNYAFLAIADVAGKYS